MPRYGVISDIHSNLPAFNAVRDALHDRHDIDHLVCAGDILGLLGNPNEIIDAVRTHVDVTVLGNHDTQLDPRRGYVPEGTDRITEYQYLIQTITDQNRDWILEQPLTTSLPDSVEMLHCRPGKDDPTGAKHNDGGVLPREFTSLDFSGNGLILGHTHTPHALDLSKFDGKNGIVLNPGSVGYPYSKEVASYGVLDTEESEATLHRAEYDATPVQNHLRNVDQNPVATPE